MEPVELRQKKEIPSIQITSPYRQVFVVYVNGREEIMTASRAEAEAYADSRLERQSYLQATERKARAVKEGQ